MGKNVEHIQHIKSNVVLDNGKPKLPQPGTLVEGELAVNYAKDVETISLENASGEVVTFSSDKYYTEQKLGSAFTGANSAVTVTDVIEENEEIISSALNDLDERKLDTSAYTPTEELWVSGTGLNSVVLKGSSGTASGDFSVAEGNSTSAMSPYSHTEGYKTFVNGPGSEHAEGYNTSAINHSHAEGDYASANTYSHAEGYYTNAIIYSHAEGQNTSAINYSHAEGSFTTANGSYSHAEGYNTLASNYSHAEGEYTSATTHSHAEGYQTLASSEYSHAEGRSTSATSQSSHAEGSETLASGNSSHAEGYYTTASSMSSHAEGYNTISSGGYGSHAEGHYALASGSSSHAEGYSTSATSDSSHAEGYETLASGGHSHAEGYSTSATGYSSHAEGSETLASGDYSHAEGDGTVASGESSHAEGYGTKANGDYSHAEGFETLANNEHEHASGRYNVSNSGSTEFGHSGNTLFSVGNGTNRSERHNAFEIRQNGDIYITSGSSDIKLQDYLGGGSGIVDQVLDDTTSASTNAVSSKAVYKAVTDNELVWTNAYVTLSGTVSAHTANTEIHVTAADKEKLHTHSNKSALDSITGNVGTMAYENTSAYSSATEVNTALGNKANTATTLAGYGITDAYTKSETSGATEISNALGEKVNSATFTGHTADTTVHVTSGEKSTWNNKQDALEFNQTPSSSNKVATMADIPSSLPANGGNADTLDGFHASAFMDFSNSDTYVSANFSDTALSVLAHTGYIEFYDGLEGAGYMNFKLGSLNAIDGLQVNGNNVIHSGNIGSQSVNYANTAGSAPASDVYEWAKASSKPSYSASEITGLGNSATLNTGTTAGTVAAGDHNHSISEITNLQTTLDGKVNTSDIISAITPSNSGSTAPIATKVVAENELTVSNALADLDERKLDATAYTPTDLSNYYTKSETSGATELTTAFAAKANTATTLAGYGITDAYTKSETSGATELTNALNNKADSAITFTAGTGLSGGGDLSANRTISLAMPTTYSAETYTSSTITSSEPIVYALVSYSGTAALNNQVCPVSSLADGQQCNVIYHSANNNAYDAVISTNYVEPDGQAITLKIPAGGYAEINYINIKGMIFVRGI